MNEFGGVSFPESLAGRQALHLAGAYPLPLGSKVLGTTMDTRRQMLASCEAATRTLGVRDFIDPGPANDLDITPTAAVCLACHGRCRCENAVKVHAEEAREHRGSLLQ